MAYDIALAALKVVQEGARHEHVAFVFVATDRYFITYINFF